MIYTADSPAVKRAERTYQHQASGGHRERLALVLTEHHRGLQARLRTIEAVRDALRAELATAQAPVALREITDDDADAARLAYQMQAPTVSSWAKCIYADNWRRVAQEIRDRLAASLPQWQPIVADDIKPGMLVRGAGCKYLIEGTVTEVSPSWITTSDASWITEGRTWEVDPRTVPTEPELVDPDTDAVEAMARAVCGDWDALPDSDRDDVRTEMRAALTAYRGWVEGDQS